MKEVTISCGGQPFWSRKLTEEEYKEWVIYSDKSHLINLNGRFYPHPISYESVLDMFLSHYRRGINLNKSNFRRPAEVSIYGEGEDKIQY